MLTKQALLGLGLMIGGGVIVFALVNQPPKPPTEQKSLESPSTATVLAEPSPLTADIETEMRILAQKQKERQAQVQAQEEQTRLLLAEQEAARTEALKKATAPATLTIQARPESVALAQEQARRAEERKKEQARQEQLRQEQQTQTQQKAAPSTPSQSSEHRVQAGDNLIRLSRQYNIPVSALAAANNMERNDPLHRGRTLKIPSQNEIAALEAKAREQEQRQQQEQAARVRQQNIDERLSNARREARRQGNNERFSVQVALAANQDNADALASRLKAAGYQVSTSPDRRGVRVIVGPERSREAALALKDKINNDPNAGTRNAWVVQP